MGTATVNVGSGSFNVSSGSVGAASVNVSGGAFNFTGGSIGHAAIAVTGTGTFAPQSGSSTLSAGSTGSGSAGATLSVSSGGTFSMVDGATGTFNLQHQSSFAGPALTLSGGTLNFDLGSSGAADLLAVNSGTAAVSGVNTIGFNSIGAPSGNYTLISVPGGGLTSGGSFQVVGGGNTTKVPVNGVYFNLTLNPTPTALHVSVSPSTTQTNASNTTGYTVPTIGANLLAGASLFTTASPTGQNGTSNSFTVLSDGDFGTAGVLDNAVAEMGPGGDGPPGPYTLTYTLAASGATNGYNITRLDTFAGYGTGGNSVPGSRQIYAVQYSTVNNPTQFTTIANVDYTGDNGTDSTWVDLPVNLTQVAAIQFVVIGPTNGPELTAYRELAAAGTPVVFPSGPVWGGTSDTNWGNGANWIGGTAPGATSGTGSTDTATFNSPFVNFQPLAIDAGRNLQNITFDTPDLGTTTIGTTTGNALLLSAGGVIQTTYSVVSPQMIEAPLVLEGNYSFNSNGSTAAALTFDGRIAPAAAAGATTLTLGGASDAINTINGVMADNGSSHLSLSVQAGNWVLGGVNTFSGATTISGGSLTIGNGTSGSLSSASAVAVNAGGALVLAAGGSLNGDTIGVNGGSFTVSGGSLGASIVNLASGTLNISSGSVGAASINASGGIFSLTGGSIGNAAISVTGSGTLAVLPGSGTLSAGSTGAGSGGASLSVGSGATFSMVDGAIGKFNLQQQSGFSGPALTLAGGTLNLEVGNSFSDQLAVNSGTVSVSGANTINLSPIGRPSGLYTLISAPGGGLNSGGSFQFAGGGTTTSVVTGTPFATYYNLTLHTSSNVVSVSVAPSQSVNRTFNTTGYTVPSASANLLSAVNGTVVDTTSSPQNPSQADGDYHTSNTWTTLADGNFGTAGVVDSAVVTVNQNPSSLIFRLATNTVAGAQGYTVSQIDSFAGWVDSTHVNQNYTVYYSTVSSPNTFIPIVSVGYNPATASNTNLNSTWVDIPAGSSPTFPVGGLTGVGAFEFVFGNQQGGIGAYREFSVEGAASVAAGGVTNWTGTTSTTWATGSNWSTGTAPGALTGKTNTDTAVFNTSTAPNLVPVVDAGRNLQNIIFDNGGGHLTSSLTLGTTTGNSLLLSAGGTIQVTSSVVNAQTVNAPLILEGNYGFTNNSGSNTGDDTVGKALNFGGTIMPDSTAGATTLTLNSANIANNVLSGILSDNGSSKLSLSVQSSSLEMDNNTRLRANGAWLLSGANTYTGPTIINGGILVVGNGTSGSIAGASAISISSIILTPGSFNNPAGALIVAAGGSIGNNSINVSNSGGLTVSGGTMGDATVNVNTGSTFTVNSGTIGNATITVDGTSTFAPLVGTGTVTMGTSGPGSAGATLSLAAGATFNMVETPITGSIGTLNLQQQSGFTGPALTLAGATLKFDVGATSTDKLAVLGGGTAAISGTNNVAITQLANSAPLPLGTYPLISVPAGGLATGGIFQLSASSPKTLLRADGYQYEQLSLSTKPTALNLVAAPSTIQTNVAVNSGFDAPQTNPAYAMPPTSVNLLHGATLSASPANPPGTSGTSTSWSVLTDGVFGPAGGNRGGTAAAVVTTGNTLTYTLASSNGGYTISEIDSYTGYNTTANSFQDYSVFYSTIANPTDFSPLIATVAFHPTGNFTTNAWVDIPVNLPDVAAIKFVFAASPSGLDGYRELSVLGTANASAPVWSGGTDNTWATGSNWTTGTAPGATTGTTNTDTATFVQATPSFQPAVIDAGRNLQNIVFDTVNVASMTIGTAGGNPLTLTSGGVILTTGAVVNPQSINAPLVLEGNYTFTSGAASTAGTLRFGGTIKPDAASGGATLTLSGVNTGANMIGGTMVDNGSAQLSLAVTGGTWVASGANSFTGSTTISGGLLRLATGGSLASLSGVSISGTGVLELAGSSSGLSNTMIVNNNSTSPNGLHVTGTNQVVNTVNGTGNTVVGDTSTASLTAYQIKQNSLTVGASGTVTLSPSGSGSVTNPTGPNNNTYSVTTLGSLTIAAGGTLDIGNNALVIAYGASGNADPYATILSLIRSGYANGLWTGTGITSSIARAAEQIGSSVPPLNIAVVDFVPNGPGFGPSVVFEGQTITNSAVLVRLTYMDDLVVSGDMAQANATSDALFFAANYGSGTTWTVGDITHDGVIDTNDALLFAANYVVGLPSLDGTTGNAVVLGGNFGGGAAVPEPASMALAALGAMSLALFVRRRRKIASQYCEGTIRG